MRPATGRTEIAWFYLGLGIIEMLYEQLHSWYFRNRDHFSHNMTLELKV